MVDTKIWQQSLFYGWGRAAWNSRPTRTGHNLWGFLPYWLYILMITLVGHCKNALQSSIASYSGIHWIRISRAMVQLCEPTFCVGTRHNYAIQSQHQIIDKRRRAHHMWHNPFGCQHSSKSQDQKHWSLPQTVIFISTRSWLMRLCTLQTKQAVSQWSRVASLHRGQGQAWKTSLLPLRSWEKTTDWSLRYLF